MFLFFVILLFIPRSVKSAVSGDGNVAKEELFACVGFDRCQCSVEFKEFSCRTAGFLEVPQSLPTTIVKL